MSSIESQFSARPLIGDAMRVIETIDKEQKAQSDQIRVAALADLVEEVYEQDGRPQARALIDHTIATMEQDPTQVWQDAPLVETTRTGGWLKKVKVTMARRRADVAFSRWGGWMASAKGRLILRSAKWGALIAAVLVLIPWLALLHVPFSLAIHHPAVFYFLTFGMISGSIYLGATVDSHDISYRVCERMKAWCIGIGVSAGILLVSGGIGQLVSLDQSDLQSIPNKTQGLLHDFSLARGLHETKGADFNHLLASANSLIIQDKSTTLRSVQLVDATKEVVSFTMSLSPNECALLPHELSDAFRVSRVNGAAVHGGQALTCGNLWSNDVVIENEPGVL